MAICRKLQAHECGGDLGSRSVWFLPLSSLSPWYPVEQAVRYPHASRRTCRQHYLLYMPKKYERKRLKFTRQLFEVEAAGKEEGCPRVLPGLGVVEALPCCALDVFPRVEYLGSSGSRINIQRPRLHVPLLYWMMNTFSGHLVGSFFVKEDSLQSMTIVLPHGKRLSRRTDNPFEPDSQSYLVNQCRQCHGTTEWTQRLDEVGTGKCVITVPC